MPHVQIQHFHNFIFEDHWPDFVNDYASRNKFQGMHIICENGKNSKICTSAVLIIRYTMILMLITIVTGPGKTGLMCTFCISRNTNLKYLMHCSSLVVQHSHARYII